MIKVEYEVFNTLFTINKILKTLSNFNLLGFDIETRSIYSNNEILEAKSFLKTPEYLTPENLILAKQIAKSSGLSCPQLVRTTHFIFGISEKESIILIAHDAKTEIAIWHWIIKFKGKFLIHNTGFDLKICYNRTNTFPSDYEDTQQLAKTYINNADNWKARVGLKILMDGYYDPSWVLFEDYTNENLKNKKSLDYAAIDGAAVYLLWQQLQEYHND